MGHEGRALAGGIIVLIKRVRRNPAWGPPPIPPVLEGLRQEDRQFEDSLVHVVRLSQKEQKLKVLG